MTTINRLEDILNNLKFVGDVEGSAVASRDGLLICSTLSLKYNAETFAAMSATMLGAAETATSELGKGIPDRIIVESKLGRIIAIESGPKALLLVMTKPDVGLGLVLVEAAKASDKISQILG